MKIEKLTHQMGKVLFNKDQLHVVCSARDWCVLNVCCALSFIYHAMYLQKHWKTFEGKLYEVLTLKYAFYLTVFKRERDFYGTSHCIPSALSIRNACRFLLGICSIVVSPSRLKLTSFFISIRKMFTFLQTSKRTYNFIVPSYNTI